ncbi:MAG TPA: EAL domain-containing protein [Thermoleophilia bacterium]|nr:EAL domain-containing protein [Thermoleophilia bacterium]HQH21667.1 EAL domain-containing protein [Thermoleophilia bacterium]
MGELTTDNEYAEGFAGDSTWALALRFRGIFSVWSARLLRVDHEDPGRRRQGQIVAFLCLPLALIGVGFFVVDLIGWLIPPSEHPLYHMTTDLLFAVFMGLAWFLNRRGRVHTAAVLMLTATSLGLILFFFFTAPHRIAIIFVAPVLVSAFVLPAWTAFAFAGVSSLSFATLVAIHGEEPRLSLQVGLSLFGLAIIAALVATVLDWAMRALHRTTLALQEDIAKRREAEEARRQVEAALELTRQRSETLFEKSPLGVFLFDREFRLTECNGRLARQLQASVEELVGTDLAAQGEGDWRSTMQRALDGAVGSFEGPWSTSGGDELWVSLTASPLRGPDGVVVGGIGVMTDLTDRKQAELLVDRLAYRDGLTDLPNRSLFNDRLGQAIAAAQRRDRGLIVGVLDLDRFKAVNDTLGHESGDELLIAVGECLSGLMRDSDSVARSAADEFLLLFPDVEPRAAAAMASRILTAIRQPWRLGDDRVFASASIGMALYPDDGTDPSTLLENAHTAMRRSKERGGGGFSFYDAALGSMAQERMRLEAELHTAIEEGQLCVYYQPQFDVRRRVIVGVEALVRWRHPRLGLVLPGEFIPLAEETGLIVPLGRQVLTAATAQAAEWHRSGSRGLRVAVNVSARQFLDPSLTTDVEMALEASGLDPAQLEIEVTETATLKHAREAEAVLARLESMGVCVALDDFGTGYSSLGQVLALPIDRLKIDRSFISEVESSERSAAVVRAVIDLGRALQLGVVAEGVETPGQFEFLRRHRCPEAQGFLLASPLSADECERLLKQSAAAPPRARRVAAGAPRSSS